MQESTLPVSTRAREFATAAMEGMAHRDGTPAIEHSKRVASRFVDPTLQAVAFLHDVVEDTPVIVADIIIAFDMRIANAVEALTRGKEEPWNAYIRRVLENPDAIVVKIADILDNLARMDEKMAASSRNGDMYRETLARLYEALPATAPSSFFPERTLFFQSRDSR